MAKNAIVRSINVGSPRDVEWRGKPLTTGIFKTPVQGPVRAVGAQLVGDHQADLRVHGGPDKAVYAFPLEHYDVWRAAYPDTDWSVGAFGENLSIEGLLESDVAVGDRYRCGDAEFIVRQPRQPCSKFAMRVGDKSAIKHMIDTGHTGFYLTIAREGTLQAGDTFEFVEGPADGLTIAAFHELEFGSDPDPAALRRAADNPHLPDSWREWFGHKAERG